MPIFFFPSINLVPLGTAALLRRFEAPELRAPSSCSDSSATTPGLPCNLKAPFSLDSVAHIWTFRMDQDERGHGSNGRGSRWGLFTITMEASVHGHWVGLRWQVRQPSSSPLLIPAHWEYSWTLRIPGKSPLCYGALVSRAYRTNSMWSWEGHPLSAQFFFTSKAWDISWLQRKQWAGGMEWETGPGGRNKEHCRDVSLGGTDLESKQIQGDVCGWVTEGGMGAKVSVRPNQSRSWLWPGSH